MIKEKEDFDIEELSILFGLKNKINDLSFFFSSSQSKPQTFLQAISLIANNKQFAETSPTSIDTLHIDSLIHNADNFYSSDNNEKLKFDFLKTKNDSSADVSNVNEIEQEIVYNNKMSNTNNNVQNNNNNDNNMNQVDNKDQNKKQKKKESRILEKEIVLIEIEIINISIFYSTS